MAALNDDNSEHMGPRQEAHRILTELHDSVKAPPGSSSRRPKLLDLGNRRRTIEKAIKERRQVRPEIFASLLQLTPSLTYDEKVRYVADYISATAAVQIETSLQVLQRALDYVAQDTETITVFDYEAHVYIRGRTVRVSESRTGWVGAKEMSDAQRAMRTASTFGWITNVIPGYQITAPSRPMCRLLGIEYSDLSGSYLLSDPLRSRLQAMLENFGEWALIIGMLAASNVPQWRENEIYALSAGHVAEFFTWLDTYVRANYREIVAQIERAPDRLVDGDSSRSDLRQCLAAAVGEAPWPAYNYNRHNTMRMHVGHHTLLTNGIARFEKRAIPIHSGPQVIGFEVSWNAERADDIANRLMRTILDDQANGGPPHG